MKREKEVERERESGRSWHNANWSSGLATVLAASTAVQTWPKQSSKREIKVGNKLDCGLSEPRRILIGKRGRLESFQKADISESTIPKNTILLLSFLAIQLLKFRPIILPSSSRCNNNVPRYTTKRLHLRLFGNLIYRPFIVPRN